MPVSIRKDAPNRFMARRIGQWIGKTRHPKIAHADGLYALLVGVHPHHKFRGKQRQAGKKRGHGEHRGDGDAVKAIAAVVVSRL